MNNSIFRTYDIRGTVPDQLTPELYYSLGRAFAEFTKAKRVVVGRDPRLSSPDFHKRLTDGLIGSGADVIDLGMVPIELVYFSVSHLRADGGLMITASHSPKEYNGLKLIGKNSVSITSINGLEEIKKILNYELRITAPAMQAGRCGRVNYEKEEIAKEDIWPEYIEKVLSFIEPKQIRPLKIVVDAGNGMGGSLIEHIQPCLPLEIIPLYFKPDGNFPNHEPNPIKPENRRALEAKVKAEKADLGVAFDTDCDRVVFIDEKGEFVQTDFIGALISEWFLENNPDSNIVYDLRRGWAIRDIVNQLKTKVWQTRAGYPFIKEKMRETDAVFGFETSGHHFFRDFNFADSGLIPLLIILEILSKNDNREFSDLISPFRERYFMIEEENFKTKNSKAIFNNLRQKYHHGKISELDGISIEFPDWHFNLRASNTEPLIRLNMEARSKEILDEKYKEIKQIIHA